MASLNTDLHMTLLSPIPMRNCEQVRPICRALAHPPIDPPPPAPLLSSTIFDQDFRLCRRIPFIASQRRDQPMPPPSSLPITSTMAMSETKEVAKINLKIFNRYNNLSLQRKLQLLMFWGRGIKKFQVICFSQKCLTISLSQQEKLCIQAIQRDIETSEERNQKIKIRKQGNLATKIDSASFVLRVKTQREAGTQEKNRRRSVCLLESWYVVLPAAPAVPS